MSDVFGRPIALRRALAIACTVGALLVGVPGAPADHRPVGDSRVVAQLPPAPGYPEGIVVRDGTIYVATAARFGTAIVPPLDPPEVQAFDAATGALTRRWVVVDKDETQDHGLSGLAFDGSGRLYAISTQWGLIRFDPDITPTPIDPAADPSVLYATAFPDLHPCGPFQAAPCSPPNAGDKPPLPNDLAFDAAGNIYVSDSLQATVFRVTPGPAPRTPEIWFQDGRLGGPFGTNGIRVGPSGDELFIVESVDDLLTGHIYRLPIATPNPGSLTEFHRYVLGEFPDNFAIGGSGKLYVALAGSNQIQVLRADGTEEARYSGPARGNDGDVLYDMPSGVALDSASGAVLVNNHSEVLGLPRHFVVFDVFVDDGNEPLAHPVIP